MSIHLDIERNRVFVTEISQEKLIGLSIFTLPEKKKKKKKKRKKKEREKNEKFSFQTSERHLAFISLAARRAEMHVWTVSKERSRDTQGPPWETSILGLWEAHTVDRRSAKDPGTLISPG